MYIRLAFATAINVDPDILVVDEVLAVGDIYYQHKCMHRIKELIEQGTTLLFVSHDMGAVKTLCKRAILLDGGRIIKQGETEGVVNEYYYRMIEKEQHEPVGVHASLTDETSGSKIQHLNKKPDIYFKHDDDFLNRVKDTRSGTGEARIRYAEVLNSQGLPISQCRYNERITVRGYIDFLADCDEPNVGFIVRDKNGNDIIGTNLAVENIALSSQTAGNRLIVDFGFKNTTPCSR